MAQKGSSPPPKIWSGEQGNKYAVVTLDKSGEITDLVRSLARQGKKSKRICLQLLPGHCLLRRLSLSSLNTHEIQSALEMWADESLPEPAEDYYLDNWMISPETHGLAAIPREPLQKARQALTDKGLKLVSLHVPELCPPRPSSTGIVLWPTDHGTLVCFWRDHVLYDWQSFLSNISARALSEQVAAICLEAPAFIYLNEMGSDEVIRSELLSAWPDADIVDIDSHSQQTADSTFNTRLTFDSYIKEQEQLSATGQEKKKLWLALVATAVAGLFLLFANVTQLEREVRELEHQVSLLKVRALRSEKVASRTGDALKKVRELRAMTTERQGIMTVLKALSDSMPPRTRLDNFTVERNGNASLDGVAETELDVSTLLEKFERTSLFLNPNLTFIQKEEALDGAKPLVRFRLEALIAQPLLSLPSVDESEEPLINQTEATSG